MNIPQKACTGCGILRYVRALSLLEAFLLPGIGRASPAPAKTIIRASDVVARLDGDEFAILMPQTDEAQAACLAERLQEHLLRNPIPNLESDLYIRISVGVTCAIASYEPFSIDVLLERADKALYKAKQQGRNQISIWSKSEV